MVAGGSSLIDSPSSAMAPWLLLTVHQTMAGTLEKEPLTVSPFKTQRQPHAGCFGMAGQGPDRRR